MTSVGIDPGYRHTGIVFLSGSALQPILGDFMTIAPKGTDDQKCQQIVHAVGPFVANSKPDIIIVEWPGDYIRGTKINTTSIRKLHQAVEWVRFAILDYCIQGKSYWPNASNATDRHQIDWGGVLMIDGLYEKIIRELGTLPSRYQYSSKTKYQAARRKYRKVANRFVTKFLFNRDLSEHEADAAMLAWYGLRQRA